MNNKIQTPDQIWAWTGYHKACGKQVWTKDGDPDSLGDGTWGGDEYIRADLHAVVVAERDNAMARADATERAFGELASKVPLPEVIRATGTVGDFAAWFCEVVAERDQLKAAMKLAHDQYMGAGGTLRPEEIVDSMKIILKEALEKNDG